MKNLFGIGAVLAISFGYATGTTAQEATCPSSDQLNAETLKGTELIACLKEMRTAIQVLNSAQSDLPDAQAVKATFESDPEAMALLKGDPGDPAIVPAGAVVAFALPSGCPSGWTRFEEGSGRMIVGVGKRVGVDGSYKLLSDSRGPIFEAGGVEMHALKIEEMPRHTHDLGTLAVNDFNNFLHATADKAEVSSNYRVPGPLFTPEAGSRNFGKHSHDLQGALATTGGGQDGRTEAHNNMPPYIALYFCKKG